MFLPLAKFRYGLAFLIYLYVFPLCQSEIRQYDSMEVDEFFSKSSMLSNILLEAEDRNIIDLEGKGITKKKYTNFLFDIQDGKRGLDMISMFSPTF